MVIPLFPLQFSTPLVFFRSTTRNDIIKLTMIDENHDWHCSIKAEVETVTKELMRNLAVVLAEDIHTDQVLKCDVVVDVINSLSITTTTRELFMEEVPEAFQLNADDAQGNEFTSLEGVEFDWKITTLGSKKEAVIVRYLPFKDSPYESLPHIQRLEDENRKGSVILLEGIKTGSAKVIYFDFFLRVFNNAKSRFQFVFLILNTKMLKVLK